MRIHDLKVVSEAREGRRAWRATFTLSIYFPGIEKQMAQGDSK